MPLHKYTSVSSFVYTRRWLRCRLRICFRLFDVFRLLVPLSTASATFSPLVAIFPLFACSERHLQSLLSLFEEVVREVQRDIAREKEDREKMQEDLVHLMEQTIDRITTSI
ncbi:hypothetical protein TGDOM2_401250 [Toxoplasma gondii GAB2-2007-GAL-DOM2]|uniref:Uncharacterized protein n=4 Tax=Toxoplasma gondii TaxID=5811 RepID=A0A425HP81_TOXGO|nr:hypothetical protein TGDOM2_401250 [Toxoplasma gondii GAB2-2007-GAL-DOM2]KFG43597.1 hypothetical protein TGP89_318760B [Toxoplasma gondii p89]PUA88451.1 hypothetical protein TGBR9_318760B [Toxoplasma gondii TgCATBr9]RQX67821.1 hypothetical protein TGCAST_318760B [Toxoplasma gondii CAST]